MNQVAKRAFKDELFEQFARIGKALSNGRRLELLELLAQRERTAEELAVEAGMSVAELRARLPGRTQVMPVLDSEGRLVDFASLDTLGSEKA